MACKCLYVHCAVNNQPNHEYLTPQLTSACATPQDDGTYYVKMEHLFTMHYGIRWVR